MFPIPFCMSLKSTIAMLSKKKRSILNAYWSKEPFSWPIEPVAGFPVFRGRKLPSAHLLQRSSGADRGTLAGGQFRFAHPSPIRFWWNVGFAYVCTEKMAAVVSLWHFMGFFPKSQESVSWNRWKALKRFGLMLWGRKRSYRWWRWLWEMETIRTLIVLVKAIKAYSHNKKTHPMRPTYPVFANPSCNSIVRNHFSSCPVSVGAAKTELQCGN